MCYFLAQRPDVNEPDSYALYVHDGRIDVWQYRVDISNPDGGWHHVETLNRGQDPRVSLEYATLSAPEADGYWIYSKTYDCRLSCE